MMKSLVSLIDETLAEVEELKKSDRFSASEIKLDGPGKGIGGQDPDGKLGKEEDDKKDDDDGKEDKDKKDDDKDMDKAEGKNREADPNGGSHQPVAKEEDAAKNEQMGYGADMMGKMEKSIDESNALIKSYVDEKIAPINDNLEKMMNLIKEIADSPVQAKGQTYNNITPLKKSADEEETLSKSEIVEKLFELKKSGEKVDSTDIVSAELGSVSDLSKIANKYNLN